MGIERLSFQEMDLLARKAGDWIISGNYLIGDYKGIEITISKEKITRSSVKDKYSITARHGRKLIGSESYKWRREDNYEKIDQLYAAIKPFARKEPAGRIKVSLAYARFLIRTLQKQNRQSVT